MKPPAIGIIIQLMLRRLKCGGCDRAVPTNRHCVAGGAGDLVQYHLANFNDAI